MKQLRPYLMGCLLFGVSGVAHAQTPPDIDCEALPAPRLFIEAGDTQMSMLGELARKLRDAENPITLIYLPRSTCTLADKVNGSSLRRQVPVPDVCSSMSCVERASRRILRVLGASATAAFRSELAALGYDVRASGSEVAR